jgi:hypothetical protein
MAQFLCKAYGNHHYPVLNNSTELSSSVQRLSGSSQQF